MPARPVMVRLGGQYAKVVLLITFGDTGEMCIILWRNKNARLSQSVSLLLTSCSKRASGKFSTTIPLAIYAKAGLKGKSEAHIFHSIFGVIHESFFVEGCESLGI
jgi:hypothetical protein